MNVIKGFALAIALVFSISVVANQCHAGITPFPGGVSSFGIPVLPGIGGNLFADVNVYWVDSGDPDASTGAGAGAIGTPFSTIDAATGQCTANQGDVVLVKPGHVETVTAAAGLALDVAGVTYIGIGNGSDRPTIRFTTATTADMNFDAANITFINFLLEARVQMLAAPIDINAADCSLFNIETRDIDSVGSCTNFIVADANADRLLIDGYKHIGTPTAGTNHPHSAISLTGGDDIRIKNFNIYGNFKNGGIRATTTACTRLNIGGGDGYNYIWTENSTDTAINAITSTGIIGPNVVGIAQDNAANLTGLFKGTSMYFINDLMVVNAVNESSTQTTIIKSTN